MQCILLPYRVEVLNMVCLWYHLAYRSIQVPWHRWTLFIFIIVVTADTRLIYLFIFSAHVLLPRKTKITKKYNRCIFEADKGKYGCFHAGPGPSFSGSWPKGVSVYFYSLDFNLHVIEFPIVKDDLILISIITMWSLISGSGLEIWRIENSRPLLVPKSSHGNFFMSDAYIILKVNPVLPTKFKKLNFG